MSSIFDMVQQQLGGNVTQQIGQRLGLDPAMTQMAVNAAIPAILGGMAAHAAHQKGADEIHAEADNHATSDAGGLLGKMVGHRGQAVQDGVAQASGIDSGKAGQLAGMLAPMIMGAIARKKQSDGLSSGQLGGALSESQGAAQAHATQQSPAMGGILGSVLSKIATG